MWKAGEYIWNTFLHIRVCQWTLGRDYLLVRVAVDQRRQRWVRTGGPLAWPIWRTRTNAPLMFVLVSRSQRSLRLLLARRCTIRSPNGLTEMPRLQVCSMYKQGGRHDFRVHWRIRAICCSDSTGLGGCQGSGVAEWSSWLTSRLPHVPAKWAPIPDIV